MAQLAERWLPTPEVQSLNPITGKYFIRAYLLLTVEKTKIKKKRLGNAYLKNYIILFYGPYKIVVIDEITSKGRGGVAQLAEPSLPKLEVRSLNPVIGSFCTNCRKDI